VKIKEWERKEHGWWCTYNVSVAQDNKANQESGVRHGKVSYCTSCKESWELAFEPHPYKKGKTLYKYEDYPSYKLNRKICPECYFD